MWLDAAGDFSSVSGVQLIARRSSGLEVELLKEHCYKLMHERMHCFIIG